MKGWALWGDYKSPLVRLDPQADPQAGLSSPGPRAESFCLSSRPAGPKPWYWLGGLCTIPLCPWLQSWPGMWVPYSWRSQTAGCYSMACLYPGPGHQGSHALLHSMHIIYALLIPQPQPRLSLEVIVPPKLWAEQGEACLGGGW